MSTKLECISSIQISKKQICKRSKCVDFYENNDYSHNFLMKHVWFFSYSICPISASLSSSSSPSLSSIPLPGLIRICGSKNQRYVREILLYAPYLVNTLNCVTSLVWIYLFDSEIIRARQCHYNVNNVFRVKWFSFKINHHSHCHSMIFLLFFLFCSLKYIVWLYPSNTTRIYKAITYTPTQAHKHTYTRVCLHST